MRVLFAFILFAASISTAAQTADALYRQACGPQDTNFDVKYVKGNIPVAPESGKALVVVIQDSPTDTISHTTTKVGIDGSWTGAIKGISYLSFDVAPGERHLCTGQQTHGRGHQVELAHFNAEAGNIYYFRILYFVNSNEYGATYGIALQPADRDGALFLVASHPMSVAKPKTSTSTY